MIAFVCLEAPFDTSVHSFVLLLRLSFCSSCTAVVNSRLRCFPFLNLIQCLCGNPPLVVGVPRTQYLITCRCDCSLHSLPPYVNGFLFHQPLQGLQLIGECEAEFLPFVGIIQKKGVITQVLVCPLRPVPPQFELQKCNQEMVVWSHICPSPDTHVLKSSSESLPDDAVSASKVIPKSLWVSFSFGRNSLPWSDCLWHMGQQISVHCHSSPLDLAAPWSPRSPC